VYTVIPDSREIEAKPKITRTATMPAYATGYCPHLGQYSSACACVRTVPTTTAPTPVVTVWEAYE